MAIDGAVPSAKLPNSADPSFGNIVPESHQRDRGDCIASRSGGATQDEEFSVRGCRGQ